MKIADIIKIMEDAVLKRNVKALQILYPEQIRIKPLPVELNGLPIWIKGAARLFKIPLDGHTVHLLYPKEPLPFEQLMRVHEALTKKLKSHVLIIADDLPPKHRPLLVKFRIPFIYKDESIFAPELGIKFGKLKKLEVAPKLEVEEKKQTLTPFGLKILAGILTDQLPREFTLKLLFSTFQKEKVKLSLSKLSMTLNELATNGILRTHGAGPQKSYSCGDKQNLWARLRDAEVSSLYREAQTNYIPKDPQAYIIAGESALSHFSNLAEPKQAVIAMTANNFRRVYQREKDTIPYGDFGSPSTVQIWKSDPKLFAIDGALNPVELYFSMRDNMDERVQMSLDEMLSRYGFKRKE